jgi:16S rRNA (cytidine1402-2'-O)-methyltransferase
MMQTMSDNMTGRLYLIPSPLGEAPMANMFPPENLSIITRIDHFIVENEKSARRFIGDVYRYLHSEKKVYNLEFLLLNINTRNDEIRASCPPRVRTRYRHFIGGGCPGVDDPGAIVVEAAHEKGIR